jgi:hypothetical protein
MSIPGPRQPRRFPRPSLERLEALEENVRILRLLFADQEGAITTLEFVHRVRGAVPPLAEQTPD